jgi:Zn-dependent protease with chaperone function
VTTPLIPEILALNAWDRAIPAGLQGATVTTALLVLPWGAAMWLPYVVRLERVPTGIGAAIWLNALALRALAVVFAGVYIQWSVPTLTPVESAFHWCLRVSVPGVHGHTHVNGHTVADMALAVPTFTLAAATVAMLVGLRRGTKELQQLLRRDGIAGGPAGSIIVADATVLVAAAGLRRPQIVVSAGALLAFDDDELAASLDHERGHIARRHRYVLTLAGLFLAVARGVPGSRIAARELMFQLERDADRYAVARDHDPVVLASAICKAAKATARPAPSTALGGGVVTRRVQLLLNLDDGARACRGIGLLTLVPLMIALIVLSAAAMPFAAHFGHHTRHGAVTEEACVD